LQWWAPGPHHECHAPSKECDGLEHAEWAAPKRAIRHSFRRSSREPRDASAASTWTGPDLIRPSKAGPLKLRCALASRPDWRDRPGVAKALVRVPSGRALQADDRRSKDET